MKCIKYITILLAWLLVSCTEEDIVKPIKGGTGNAVQFVARIMSFDDVDVSSRSPKSDPKEYEVKTLTLVIFDSDYKCVYTESDTDGDMVFSIDRGTEIEEKDGVTVAKNGTFIGVDQSKLQDCKIYAVANFPGVENLTKGATVNDYMELTAKVTGIDVPKTGMPMLGQLEPENDDEKINLSMTGDNIVKGGHLFQIHMEALYAKIVFNIDVKSTQSIEGFDRIGPPKFRLDKYFVHNVVESVNFVGGTESSDGETMLPDDDVIGTNDGTALFGRAFEGTLPPNKEVVDGDAKVVSFSFYLPERFLQPQQRADEYLYPFKLDNTGSVSINGIIREEDKNYRQRFKPLLAKDNATYVTFSGYFYDHQGYSYDVSYDIYLGSDNYGNFDIVRNRQYNNNITIKGINTSKDNYDSKVSIDHRVNVERTLPIIINLQRETLLDSHFEVRPLRIRLNGKHDNGNIQSATMKVEVLNADDPDKTGQAGYDRPNWIRIENKNDDDDDDGDLYLPNGKRKYFTYNLVSGKDVNGNVDDSAGSLVNSHTLSGITVSKNASKQCVWIYVDECTDSADDIRSAVVRVSWGNGENEHVDYVINQRMLFPVTYTNGTASTSDDRSYYIEYYEEYLYNYDAEDPYGQTKEEGMPWGLNDVQLSNEHNSFYIDENNTDWNNYVKNNTLLKYDFYIAKYDAFVRDGVTVHGFAGQHFTQEIFDATKNNSDVNKKVNVLTMADQPKGAVEYCYNRNKRDAKGNVVKVEWYLPSADELEDFIVPAYSTFKEFQDNYYWTSQPAYIRDAYYYEYATGGSKGRSVTDAYAFVAYEDNKQYARATKVVAKGNDVYEYALSGLTKIPTDAHNMDAGCINAEEQLLDGAYFSNMYAWYRWNGGTDPQEWTEDTHYNEKKNGSETGVRYHVHVGHTFDKMYQVNEIGEHGYHPRTKSNRVRCARRDWNPDNNFEMEIVYTTVSTTPATTLDKSGKTVYVMRNTAYADTYLTTSGDNVAAEEKSAVGTDNYVVIEGNKIKSVAKNQYFYGDGDGGNVSFNDNGRTFTISSSGNNFTISYTGDWWQTYYLKQTSNTAVQMNRNDNGNYTWQFYEVKKEYKVVE